MIGYSLPSLASCGSMRISPQTHGTLLPHATERPMHRAQAITTLSTPSITNHWRLQLPPSTTSTPVPNHLSQTLTRVNVRCTGVGGFAIAINYTIWGCNGLLGHARLLIRASGKCGSWGEDAPAHPHSNKPFEHGARQHQPKVHVTNDLCFLHIFTGW